MAYYFNWGFCDLQNIYKKLSSLSKHSPFILQVFCLTDVLKPFAHWRLRQENLESFNLIYSANTHVIFGHLSVCFKKELKISSLKILLVYLHKKQLDSQLDCSKWQNKLSWELFLCIIVWQLNLRLRPFIHGGKDEHKSCTAHHGEPVLCPCLRTTCNLFGYFSGLGKVASPSSNEHGSWWAWNIRPFDWEAET